MWRVISFGEITGVVMMGPFRLAYNLDLNGRGGNDSAGKYGFLSGASINPNAMQPIINAPVENGQVPSPAPATEETSFLNSNNSFNTGLVSDIVSPPDF